MSNQPKYGNITVHQNCAGLVYMRFLEVDKDEPSKFIGRVMDPKTMRVHRYTEQDAKDGICIPSAVGLPVRGWGYLNQIKHVCKTVRDAKVVWYKVGHGWN